MKYSENKTANAIWWVIDSIWSIVTIVFVVVMAGGCWFYIGAAVVKGWRAVFVLALFTSLGVRPAVAEGDVGVPDLLTLLAAWGPCQ